MTPAVGGWDRCREGDERTLRGKIDINIYTVLFATFPANREIFQTLLFKAYSLRVFVKF